ncbi:DUF3857 domain-containing protein [Roseivirga sp.]|uniref:DUF3857 domain-containing protein n=1 Tax=Roseivirga sp. TaxID=1964215 RepID=UPI003B8CA58E
MKKFIIAIVLIFFQLSLFAQEKSFDRSFGQVSLDDLEMKYYEKDSSAEAVYLYDKGKIGFDVQRGLVYFEYHAQIKIFDKRGFYLADLTLPYSIQKGTELEAITHTLINGKAERIKVGNDEIRDEMVSEGLYSRQISFPNVIEGVILEYQYRVFSTSPFDFLPWYFQSKIPVEYSEFILNIPGGFNLKPRLYGYNDLYEYDDGTNYSYWHTLKMIDIPAFVEEPYVNKIDDHISKVTFEYESFFAPSWEELNKLIMNTKGFGELIEKIKRINYYPKSKGWENNLKSLKSIHQYISNHFDWTGEYGLSFSDKPKTIWKSGRGTSADINLLMLMFLRKAGIDTKPIFLSTLDHGLVNKEFINYQQFNNLVVYAKIGEEEFLLDATSKMRRYDILPDVCINGEGLVIDNGDVQWVSMNLNQEVAMQATTTKYTINVEDLSVKGSARVTSVGAAAANSREVFSQLDSLEISEWIEAIYGEMSFDSISNEGLEERASNFSTSFQYEAEDWVESIGDRLFFNPVTFKEIDQNPFKLTERTLPIDFTMPIRNTYIFNIDVPDGFDVEEVPISANYVLPDNAGMYTYQAQVIENTINIIVRFAIKKTFFAPSEYGPLRELFNLIVAKQNEKVALIKK